MSNETITDLRTHLFATLKGLTDKNDPMDIARAKAVSDVAQVIINSAKVEVEHMKISGEKGSGFIPLPSPPVPGVPAGTTVVEQKPGVTVTRHQLR